MPNTELTREDEFLALCRRIYRKDTGFNTPYEELVCDLVRKYGWTHGRVDPEDVDSSVETFHEHYETVMECAEYAVANYPEAVEQLKQAASAA